MICQHVHRSPGHCDAQQNTQSKAREGREKERWRQHGEEGEIRSVMETAPTETLGVLLVGTVMEGAS